MIAVCPSRPGLGEQMAEVVLATALAVPVLFAFAELRGTRLAGPPASVPQLTEPSPYSDQTPFAPQPSPPVRVILSGNNPSETSVWEARLAVLMEAIRIVGYNASESTVKEDAAPRAVNADEPAETIAERVPPDGNAGRSTRPAHRQSVRTTGH
jgi:hypothetical protein